MTKKEFLTKVKEYEEDFQYTAYLANEAGDHEAAIKAYKEALYVYTQIFQIEAEIEAEDERVPEPAKPVSLFS